MFTKIVSIVILFAVGAGTLVYGFQDQPTQKDSKKFMQQKLNSSMGIVKGLATEDFDLISKSGQDLLLYSHEADWNVFQTQEYLAMSRDFRGSAQRLRDSANSKNLDGSTLAYFEVTLNCVRCHKYVRQTNQLENQ
jgi:cytochrome c556